jgi:hypothetical protein
MESYVCGEAERGLEQAAGIHGKPGQLGIDVRARRTSLLGQIADPSFPNGPPRLTHVVERGQDSIDAMLTDDETDPRRGRRAFAVLEQLEDFAQFRSGSHRWLHHGIEDLARHEDQQYRPSSPSFL